MMKLGFANFVFLIFALLMAGCTRSMDTSTTPMPTLSLPSETQTPPPATALPVVEGESTAEVIGPALSKEVAVILVSETDTLNLRSAAGVENAVVHEVASNAVGLVRIGSPAFSGDELWVELLSSTGETGWVNARFLTEYVPHEEFCRDPQVQFLFGNLLIAVETKNGELFSSLVSPVHGLDLRYFHHGTLANYTPEEAAWAFQSTYDVIWGYAGGSGEEISGTFSEVPLPRLLEVFGSEYELHCNDVGITSAFAQEPWPPEYANINFYNVLKPGTEQYGGFDWRAWLVGIEYVGGKPYLFAMTSFEWEP